MKDPGNSRWVLQVRSGAVAMHKSNTGACLLSQQINSLLRVNMVIFSRSNSVCSSPGRSPTDSESGYRGVNLEASFYENQLGNPEYNGERTRYFDGRPYERAGSSYASSNSSTPLKEQSPFRDMGNPQASSQNQIYK
jgi:hypothetical protein